MNKMSMKTYEWTECNKTNKEEVVKSNFEETVQGQSKLNGGSSHTIMKRTIYLVKCISN